MVKLEKLMNFQEEGRASGANELGGKKADAGSRGK